MPTCAVWDISLMWFPSGIISARSCRNGREGDITDEAAKEIVAIVDAADIHDFRPIFSVIPFSLVRDKVEPVPVSQRAHPLSAEFVIRRLPRNSFDALGVDGI